MSSWNRENGLETNPTSVRTEDDDIRRYLGQHFTAAGSADSDSNLPLPDFGILPKFSSIKLSLNEEPKSNKKKSPDPYMCNKSSSLPCCMSVVATLQQTIAGN